MEKRPRERTRGWRKKGIVRALFVERVQSDNVTSCGKAPRQQGTRTMVTSRNVDARVYAESIGLVPRRNYQDRANLSSENHFRLTYRGPDHGLKPKNQPRRGPKTHKRRDGPGKGGKEIGPR